MGRIQSDEIWVDFVDVIGSDMLICHFVNRWICYDSTLVSMFQ